MTTVAIFKWAMNPHDERLGADGALKWNATAPEVGDDDHAVVAVANALQPGEAIGLTFAGRNQEFAAARGAVRTVALEGLEFPAQSSVVAEALAIGVKSIEGADQVIIGDATWDPGVAGLLAARLGWPLVTAVDEAHAESDGALVVRRYGSGTQEVKAPPPFVLDVAARREEEAKPGMRDVLAARKKPVETVDASAAVSAPVFALRGTHEPDAIASRIFDGSDPADAARQLVAALRADGLA